jgi:hypothetical protein
MTAAYAVKGIGQESLKSSSAASPQKRIAAITSTFSMRSVADNIITRLLQGYWIGNSFHESQCNVVSLYVDQMEAIGLGPRISEAYGIALTHSVPEALMSGKGSLAVDGVVLICDDDIDDVVRARSSQDLKFRLFEQIVNVFRKTGRSVPVFCAGRLAADLDHAKRMQQWSREMSFPLMAGAPTAVTFRRPDLDYPLPHDFDDAPLGDRAHHELPLGVDFDEALVICPSGLAAAFGGLEIAEAFLERRRGGETGVRSLECLLDAAVWKSAQDGHWSTELMHAAWARAKETGNLRPEEAEHPELCLIEYNDGTRSAILSLGDMVSEFLAAFRLKGRKEIDSTLCYMPAGSANEFSMLVEGITRMVMTGVCPYPIERSLLTTGVFFEWLGLRHQSGGKIETPTLNIAYAASEHSFYAQCRGW